MDQTLKDFDERIKRIEALLKLLQPPSPVVAPEGGTVPTAPGGAPSPAQAGPAATGVMRPAGDFATPEQVQQAAVQQGPDMQRIPPQTVQPIPAPPPLRKDPLAGRDSPIPLLTAPTSERDPVPLSPAESRQQQVTENAQEEYRQRADRMRSRGQTPHMDRFNEGYVPNWVAREGGGAADPPVAPPPPGDAQRAGDHGMAQPLAGFAEATAGAMQALTQRIVQMSRQMEDIKVILEAGGQE